MLVHRESAVFAGTAVVPRPAYDAPQGASRPFGPFPRSVVALYGVALAGSGLTLCFQAGTVDAYWSAGAGAVIAGVWCVRLAARAGRRPHETATDVEPTPTTETEDTAIAAARVVTTLDDLRRQLDELGEQCEAYTGIVAASMVSELDDVRRQLDELSEQSETLDVQPADVASPAPPQAAPRRPQPSDPRFAPAGTRSVRIALPLLSAVTLTALLGRLKWGRARH